MSPSGHRYEQDFGPFDDDYRGFDTTEEGARGPLILALAVGVMLIFGAVIWNTYRQGIRGDTQLPPIVLADASPYKTVPEEPGGLEMPDQNRRIYDQIDGSERAAPDGPIAVSADDDVDINRLLQGGPPIELRPGQEAEIDEVTGIPRAAIEQLEALEDKETVQVEALPDVLSPTETVVAPAPDEIAPTPSRFTADGDFLVQVAALRTQQAADAAWDDIARAEPTLFSGAEKNIQRADLGAKGVFYRVRVGTFGAREQATSFCDTLKERGRNCIVVSG